MATFDCLIVTLSGIGASLADIMVHIDIPETRHYKTCPLTTYPAQSTDTSVLVSDGSKIMSITYSLIESIDGTAISSILGIIPVKYIVKTIGCSHRT